MSRLTKLKALKKTNEIDFKRKGRNITANTLPAPSPNEIQAMEVLCAKNRFRRYSCNAKRTS